MKELFITCIYSHLHGTELGGRCGRWHHYRWSLLNILNLNPSKIVCFTHEDEIDDLKTWFYDKHNVDPKVLEFKVFDLSETKHYDKIQEIKDVEHVKKWDRCHEIQYNKFFWAKLIEDRHDYDRVYWIDAGLSHGGLFPEKYQVGDVWESHFNISMFRPKILKGWNELSEDKILLMAKNNTLRYHWSKTLPEHFYKTFNNDKHIIGGMFGGTSEKYDELAANFEKYLLNVLDKSDNLCHEELIMCCMYADDMDSYATLDFDDWYERPEWKQFNPKLFHHLFI